MIVLDTNVISLLITPRAEPGAIAWVMDHASDAAIASPSFQELAFGAARLPDGARKEQLVSAIDNLRERFRSATIGLGSEEAILTGTLLASRMASGRPMSLIDAQIAGICLANGASLATRNVRDFEGTGLEVVDPWAA